MNKNKLHQRIMTSVLSAAMVIGLLPISAAGEGNTFTADISKGSISISSSEISYYGEDPMTETFSAGDSVVITGSTTENIVTVDGVEANITLSNADIQLSGNNECAFALINGATVNLTLENTNTLTSGAHCAGLQAPSGTELTINGDGTLVATGGVNGAGIGGSLIGAGGTVTINGGTVTATGTTDNDTADGGAGIGGGSCGAGGTLTITGGTVHAGRIGSGMNGDDSHDHYYISGGSVNTTGIRPTPQFTESDVYLTTVTLDGVAAKTTVSWLDVTYNSTSYSYGTNDMYTDMSGKLYLWLPEGAEVTEAAVGDTSYSGSITTSTNGEAAGTLTANGGSSGGGTETKDVFDYSNTPDPDVFYLRVEIASNNDVFQVPTSGTTGDEYEIAFDWSIDWGDKSEIEEETDATCGYVGISHTYTNKGTYIITIKLNGTASEGWFRAFGFSNGSSDADALENKAMLTGFTGVFDDTSIGFGNIDNLLSNLFYECTSLTAGNISINTNVTSECKFFAHMMFSECKSLKELPSGFNLPSEITLVGSEFACEMFEGCTALTSLPSGFNLPNKIETVGNYFVESMFADATNLKINSDFKFPNFTQEEINLDSMFFNTFKGLEAEQDVGAAARILSNLPEVSPKGDYTKIYPSEDRDTFSEVFNNDKSWNAIHANWKATPSSYEMPDMIDTVNVKSDDYGGAVTVTGLVTLTFKQPMDNETNGTVTLYDQTVNQELTALSGGAWKTNESGEYVKYAIPYNGLEYNQTYSVKLSGFKNAAGKEMEAVTDTTKYEFTTKAKPTVPNSGSVFFNGNAATGENPFYYGIEDGADLVYGNPVTSLTNGYSWDKENKTLTLNGFHLTTEVDGWHAKGLGFWEYNITRIDGKRVFSMRHPENSDIKIVIADDSTNTITSNGRTLCLDSSNLDFYGGNKGNGTLTIKTTATNSYACLVSGGISQCYGGNVIFDAPNGNGYATNNSSSFMGGTLFMKGGAQATTQMHYSSDLLYQLTYSDNYDGSEAIRCYINSQAAFDGVRAEILKAKYVYFEEAFAINYNSNGGTGTVPDSQKRFITDTDSITLADGSGLARRDFCSRAGIPPRTERVQTMPQVRLILPTLP